MFISTAVTSAHCYIVIPPPSINIPLDLHMQFLGVRPQICLPRSSQKCHLFGVKKITIYHLAPLLGTPFFVGRTAGCLHVSVVQGPFREVGISCENTRVEVEEEVQVTT